MRHEFPEQPASMKDVAIAAGFSKMTVSRALRNDPGVASETRKQILETARKLGYRPNPVAALFMRQHRHSGTRRRNAATIAALSLMPTASAEHNPLSRRLIWKGIREEADTLGYQLDEFYPIRDDLSPERMERILKARGIRCVLFPAPRCGRTCFPMNMEHFTSVTFGQTLEEPRIIHVGTNPHHDTYRALEILWQRGFRRIGLAVTRFNEEREYMNHLSGYWWGQSRFKGLRHIPWLDLGCPDEEFGKWLDRHRPEVIIGRIKGYERLRKLNCRIPDDIGFVSLASSSSHRYKNITSLEPQLIELGRITVSILNQRHLANLTGEEKYPRIVLIDGQWVEGTSLPSARNAAKQGKK